MCYSEFNDIIDSVAALDADVISIETSRREMERLLQKALEVLAPEQLWVIPNRGLKTRGWEEVRPALASLVEAARRVREKHRKGATSGE
jgi:5-methyltetrahydropteroyltriglutamate--homocysteine methyltransferase